MLIVNLSNELEALARARAAERGHATLEAYLASLIEADQAVPVSEALESVPLRHTTVWQVR